MYLSRLVLNRRCRAVRRDLGDCHNLHRTLMSAFPDLGNGGGKARARLGLLYRLEEDVSGARVLVQSEREPDWSNLDPEYFLRPPECKRVAELYASLEAGQLLRFRLRANPTRKIKTKSGPDGRRNNGKRVELRTEGEWLAWLQRKGVQHGFRLQAVSAVGQVADVRTIRFGKLTGRKDGGPLTFFAVEFEGRLVIESPGLFKAALRNGIGPGKAYGLGLLSIAPG